MGGGEGVSMEMQIASIEFYCRPAALMLKWRGGMGGRKGGGVLRTFTAHLLQPSPPSFHPPRRLSSRTPALHRSATDKTEPGAWSGIEKRLKKLGGGVGWGGGISSLCFFLFGGGGGSNPKNF